jgi:hypothetical protein
MEWKFQSSQTYPPRLACATPQFLCYGGDGIIEWQMFLVSVITSMISMFMTTLAHNMISTELLHVGYGHCACFV